MFGKTFGRKIPGGPPGPTGPPLNDGAARAQRMDEDLRHGQALLDRTAGPADHDAAGADRAMVFAAAARPLLDRRGAQAVRHLPDGDRARLEAIWHACFSPDDTFAAHVATRPPDDGALLWELRTHITSIEARRRQARQRDPAPAGTAWQPPEGAPEAQADAWIRDHQAPAYELRRRDPTGAETLSYLGGAPTLPPDMPWPEDPATGRHRPFLGQIDLSTLPPLPGSPLPADGVLFFFLVPPAPPHAGEPAPTAVLPQAGAVLYAPHSDAVPRAPVPPPASLPALGGRLLHGGHCFGHERRDPDEVRHITRPRFEVDILPTTSVRAPPWTLTPSALLTAIHQRLEALEPPPGPIDETGAGLPPGRDAAPTLAGLRAWAAADGPWPLTWGIVELLTRRGMLPRGRLNPGRLEGPLRQEADAVHATRREALAQWRDQAIAAGRATVMPPSARRAVRSWIVESFVAENQLWLASMGVAVEDMDPETAWTRMSVLWDTDPLRATTLDGLALALDSFAGAPERVPAAVRDAWAAALRPAHGRHQMLGHGALVQNAALTDDVLLLQLRTDPGMLATWADSATGALQIWIAPEDLAARAFDCATTTIEGG